MNEETPPSLSFDPVSHPVSPRLGLFIVLIASTASVLSAVAWIFHRVHQSLGREIAEVSVAMLAILILVLIFAGAGVGLGARSALRTRQDQAERVYCLFGRCRTFREFWLYLGLEVPIQYLATRLDQAAPTEQPVEEPCPVQQTVTIVPASPVAEDAAWPLELRKEVTKPGRPPEHSIQRWARVVSAWERRDLWYEPITLDEFLCREFGVCKDGSPQVSKSTFYEWRRKVHRAAKEQIPG